MFKRLKFLGLTSTSVPSEVGPHSCLKNSFQPHYLAHSFVGWSSPPKNTLFKKPASKKVTDFFLNKWANPGLFFVYFLSFQTNIITICTKIRCEKCPNRIQCQDSNQQPLECESLPITTIPGLPPITDFFL